MIIGLRQQLEGLGENPEIVINNDKIKRVNNKKVLGIIIDDQLKWNKHSDEQCKRISKSISLLRKAKDFVSQDILKIIYNFLVLLRFNYCSTVWHDNNKTHINKLHQPQKRAPRIITSSDYRIRSAQIFQNLYWKPISENLGKRDLLMKSKALKGMTPNYIQQLFNSCNNRD